ncbi:bacterio-opsin activator domain-containing protein [Halopiger goleimassiliensis]|uniref:bacterio-opsin activator domain-containing protein n=1 Tax=Halopiger goleimassiliensis TaxID=1293048 RepID=UPI0006779DD8|nr:bacterio-opsin activator domain-containing protein [Halopiger goleimassiliensis]
MCEESHPIEDDPPKPAAGSSTRRSRCGPVVDAPPRAPVLERIDDPVYAVDEASRCTYANDAAREQFDVEPDDVLDSDGGTDVRTSEERADGDDPSLPFAESHRRALEHGQPVTTETYYEPADAWFEGRCFPDDDGVTVYVRDVTDRKRRELELEEGNRRLRSIFEDAHDAILLGDDDGITAANPAASELLGLEREELYGRSFTEFLDDDSDFREAWETFLEEGRQRGSRSIDRPDGEERIVEYNAVAHVLPGTHMSILRDVTEARKRERELERQRERLAALDHVNRVVREINAAIVDGSNRDELEHLTCETLASSPSYEFAFVLEVDAATGAISERVEAGVDGYLASIDLSTDADEPIGRGPVGQAVRTQEVQVVNDVFDDPAFEPWRDAAREFGYRSAAAIPIVHDGVLYGILGIASGRSNAFTDEECDVVAQLGEILGHAIAALERRRVLLGDAVTELELVIDDATTLFDGPPMTDRTIQFDRVVRIGDGEYLEYGSTAPETYPAIEELVDCVPHWESVSVVEESRDRITFELQIDDPPLFSLVDAYGGYVDEAAIHDGDYVTTLHLPAGTDVRSLLEDIKQVYPETRTLAHRQRSPATESIDRLQEYLSEKLTDRQRTALETAYAAGYFEWPRNSSGEDVAQTLDVTPATFHEHLRAAQEKVFETILEDEASGPGR